jgi:membrane protease subunit HflK
MTKENHQDNKDLQPQFTNESPGDELDAAGKSLSEALRISFIILKIIMFILVIVFLASGFRTVGPDEQALVLRFGKIRGIGENRLLGPGPHWVFPYPIDKIVKIPVAKKVNLPINSFWYSQKQRELLPQGPKKSRRLVPETLNPLGEGYCITRSEKQSKTIAAATSSDYHLVHCKWQLIYQIDDPERFFKNVAVVATMVNYTIDEARSSDERISRDVKKLLREKLNKIESGIAVVSVQLTDIIWPRQVDTAFQASITASQESQKFISEAKGYAENTLNETAGPIAEELLTALGDKTINEQEKELMWSQLAGTAQEKIAQARAYRTKVVEVTKANAEYLQKLLPEYRKHPKLVIQKIYQDAIEYVLNNADEKMIIQPAEGTKGREIRVLLNRDPMIKPKSKQ